MKKTIRAIRDLAENLSSVGADRAIYGLFLCLSDSELVEAFDEFFTHSILIHRVEKHICRRLNEGEKKAFQPLIQRLVRMARADNYNDQLVARRLLYVVRTHLTKPQLREFFNTLIGSSRYADRARAYNIAGDVWSKHVENSIWNSWCSRGHIKALMQLAKHGSLELLLQVFPKIWDNEQIDPRAQRAMLKRIACLKPGELKWIRSTNPLSYLYAMAVSNTAIKHSEGVDLASNANDETELGFAFWCLGKLRMSRAIIEARETFESDF